MESHPLTEPTTDECVGSALDDRETDNKKRNTALNRLEELTDKSNPNTSPLSYRELRLTNQGFIELYHIIKMPIVGKEENQPIPFLFHAEDLTLQEDPFDLFQLYQKHYFLPQEATEKFLGYLGAAHYFCTMPSYDEVQVLIAMMQDSDSQQVARLLGQDHEAVDHHIYTLGSKLQDNITLPAVLSKIRSKWIPVPASKPIRTCR